MNRQQSRGVGRHDAAQIARSFGANVRAAIGVALGVALGVAVALAGPAPHLAPALALADEPPPRLVVLIVVDQCRPDYFERFASRFTGFFARLREQGRWFLDGEQHHAFTVTAAGHAALGSGRFPAENGIVGNDFFDAASGRNVNATSDPAAKAVGGLGGGHSGHRLRCDALGDWWKAAHPAAKVVGVALKPRSAILPLGRGGHSAWWFDDGKGTFVSSTRCVGETLPEWAARFADGRPCDRFPAAWEATLEEADYEALACTVDDEPTEAPSGTRPTRTFPHALDERDLARRASALAVSPFGDELVLDFARAAVEGESFGDDAVPDLLLVGLSSTDLIGHRHGPDSREIAEQLLALDRALARFVAFLETRVGAGAVLFALSSDHGVPSLPAVARARGREGDWIDWTTLEPSVRAALSAIDPALEKAALSLPNTSLRLDRAVLAAAGREVEPVARALAAALRKTPPFRDARSHAELQEPLAPDDRIGLRLRATSDGDRAGDLLFVLPPGTIYLSGGARVASVTKGLATSHGTAWDDDTRVPLVFLGAGVAPAQISGRAWTVDVAPTLARAIGLALPSDLDGTPLPLH